MCSASLRNYIFLANWAIISQYQILIFAFFFNILNQSLIISERPCILLSLLNKMLDSALPLKIFSRLFATAKNLFIWRKELS